MTNTEKYLKDNVSVEEFLQAVIEHCSKGTKYSIETFLNEEAKPTLTEDERVILRNIDKHFYTKIFRNECLFLRGKHTSDLVFTQYDHLFQFIKERGRI